MAIPKVGSLFFFKKGDDMNIRTFTIFLSLSCVVMVAAIVGCATTQSIPYATRGRHLDELPLGESFEGRCLIIQESSEKPVPEPKYDRELTLRINEEVTKLVVSVKPMNIPGTTSLVFHVGESMKSNLENTLRPLFRSVNFSTSPLKEVTNKGTVLDVELKSYDFNIASSIFGTHTSKLAIQYSLYEKEKNIFTYLADTSGGSRETSSICTTMDDMKRFSIPTYPATYGPYVLSVGNSYDVALGRSLELLLDKLNEAWTPPKKGN